MRCDKHDGEPEANNIALFGISSHNASRHIVLRKRFSSDGAAKLRSLYFPAGVREIHSKQFFRLVKTSFRFAMLIVDGETRVNP